MRMSGDREGSTDLRADGFCGRRVEGSEQLTCSLAMSKTTQKYALQRYHVLETCTTSQTSPERERRQKADNHPHTMGLVKQCKLAQERKRGEWLSD